MRSQVLLYLSIATVAAALANAGLPLAVVNPRQIRDFARALDKLAKTDAIDAKVIAIFAEKISPQARPIASLEPLFLRGRSHLGNVG